MSGFYTEGEYDLSGFAVSIVKKIKSLMEKKHCSWRCPDRSAFQIYELSIFLSLCIVGHYMYLVSDG